MKASTKRILSIFGSLTGLFVALAMLSNSVLPGWGRLAAVRMEIEEKEAARGQLEELVSQARVYLSRQGELERQAQPIDAALPVSPDIPELIAVLNVLATANRTILTQLRFELEPFRSQPGAAATGPEVSRVIVRANVVGTYPNIKAWLRNVESELRLIDVHILNLQSTVGEQTAAADTPLNAEVAITSYWQQ